MGSPEILLASRTLVGLETMSPIVYRLLADLVVVVHFTYVAFVLVGAILVLIGALRHWAWVRNFWFRAVHLLMIGVVVAESFCDVLCPLTDWEDQLRELAGETVASGTFVGRLTHWLLFYDIPHSTLVISYYVFGFSVLLTWILVPPRWPWKRRNN